MFLNHKRTVSVFTTARRNGFSYHSATGFLQNVTVRKSWHHLTTTRFQANQRVHFQNAQHLTAVIMSSSSTQKQRRNFRNSKNNKEHRLKQKKDDLRSKEEELERLQNEFSAALSKLVEFEEINIFSRDDEEQSVGNVLAENLLLSGVAEQYWTTINGQKANWRSTEQSMTSICGEIKENAIFLERALQETATFFDGMECGADGVGQRVRDKMNKMGDGMEAICDLVMGKAMESETAMSSAKSLSTKQCDVEMEQNQYRRIRSELQRQVTCCENEKC